MNVLDFSWWTAERVSAAANTGVLIVAVVTAVIGLIAVFQTKQIIRQNEEARTEHAKEALESQRQQEEYNRIASDSAKHQETSVKLQQEAVERANRPMMTVRYLPPESSMDTLDIEVSNVGKTVAYNVTIEFEPPLPAENLDMLNSNSDPGQRFYSPNVELPRTVFVNRTFHTWVPGQKVTAPFWVTHKDYKVGDRMAISAEGIPATQQVLINYQDEKGDSYAERFELDPGIWVGKTFGETDLYKQRRAVEKIEKSIKNLSDSFIKQFQTFVNRTTAPTSAELERRQKWETAVAQIRSEVSTSRKQNMNDDTDSAQEINDQ